MAAPYPPCMSTYSLPSTSQTWEPRPWLIHTACGCAICQFEVAPPASEAPASAVSAVLRGCRRTNASDSDSRSASTVWSTATEVDTGSLSVMISADELGESVVELVENRLTEHSVYV